jgi:Ca2+-binding EF-hand superfamily protein
MSIIVADEHHHEDEDGENYSQFDFLEMAEETDETLASYDDNNDGVIHYGEFYRNHKKMLEDQK